VVRWSNQDGVTGATSLTLSYYRTVSTLAHIPVVPRVGIHRGNVETAESGW
jgi:hypothetical protein